MNTVDDYELKKFAQHADHWWDKDGPLKTLHDINQTRLDYVRQYASLTQESVLDLGCGGGIFCEAMARVGAQVTGVDAEASAIQVATEHAQHAGLAIDYHCSAVEDFEHAGFSVITCMELLEHVRHPELLLSHAKRLLKPGGLLFLSTINRTLKAYLGAILAAEYLLNIVPRQTHEYKKLIKPSELAVIGRSLGLELVDVQGLSYNPWTRTAQYSADVSINYLLVFRSLSSNSERN